MMPAWACFSCCSSPLVPEGYNDLHTEKLKSLFKRSIYENNGDLFVHGLFAIADVRNNNKRVYTKNILEREVAKFVRKHCKKGTSFGELDHPSYSSEYYKHLNLPNVSHQVLDVTWKDDQLWGTIQILPTPSGLLLKELYAQGVKVGVSLRGWASQRTDPVTELSYVENDFQLITFDFVTEPSFPGAYLVPVQTTYWGDAPRHLQERMIQVAQFGYGMVPMNEILYIPAAKSLAIRLAELLVKYADIYPLADATVALERSAGFSVSKVLSASAQPRAAAADPTGGKHSRDIECVNNLDRVLLFGHYLVREPAPFIHHEESERDYWRHVVAFAYRAYLNSRAKVIPKTELGPLVERALEKLEQDFGGDRDIESQQQEIGMSAFATTYEPTSKTTPTPFISTLTACFGGSQHSVSILSAPLLSLSTSSHTRNPSSFSIFGGTGAKTPARNPKYGPLGGKPGPGSPGPLMDPMCPPQMIGGMWKEEKALETDLRGQPDQALKSVTSHLQAAEQECMDQVLISFLRAHQLQQQRLGTLLSSS